LKLFIQYMIDFHNCMTLAKSIRWKTDKLPLFIKGGTIEPAKLKRIHLRDNLEAVLSAFRDAGHTREQ
jgi:vacuolar-type H+-ATPase subunit C/Vma6